MSENINISDTSDEYEISYKKVELKRLGKRLLFAFSCVLIVGYPALLLVGIIISLFNLNFLLEGNAAYITNFLCNDIFARGSVILVCFLILKEFCKVKYEDKTTGFKKYELVFWLPVMIMLGVCGSYIMNLITVTIQFFGGSGELKDPLQSVQPLEPWMFLCYLIFVGITGPILEEVVFRGIFLRALRPYGDMTAILVTSAMFGIYHLNFSQLLYTAFIGLVLAAVAVRSNSIVPSIILHVINNLMVTFINYSQTAISGNDTPTLLDNLITSITNGINFFLEITPFLALVGFIFIIKLKLFSVGDNFPELSIKKRLKIMLCRPAALISFVFIIFMMIMNV